MLLQCAMTAPVSAQPDSNYDASQVAISAYRAASGALQSLVSRRIPARVAPLPHETAIAGTLPDCPLTLMGYILGSRDHHVSKVRTQNQEVIVIDSNAREKLLKRGHLCEPVDHILEMAIMLGAVLQEVHNAGSNAGPHTPQNERKWERDGHKVNNRFLQAIKYSGLIADPVSRKKLCRRIDEFCNLIQRLS